MKVVNELSLAKFTARPVDVNGALFTPTNARYRMDDLDSRQNKVAWTDLTPSTSMTFTIPASAHDIIHTNRKREQKVLTVETDYGTSNAHVEEFIYWVKNLHFVS